MARRRDEDINHLGRLKRPQGHVKRCAPQDSQGSQGSHTMFIANRLENWHLLTGSASSKRNLSSLATSSYVCIHRYIYILCVHKCMIHVFNYPYIHTYICIYTYIYIHCIVLHCITLHTLHYITYIILHYITLHYINTELLYIMHIQKNIERNQVQL